MVSTAVLLSVSVLSSAASASSEWAYRIHGADRYLTSVALVKISLQNSPTDTVVLTSGVNWPDALSASGMAGSVRAPVLLVPPRGLYPVALRMLQDYGVTRVLVAGGPSAVPHSAVAGLDRWGVKEVARVSGPDRYATAADAYAHMDTAEPMSPGTAYLVSGESYVDALAVGPFAWHASVPVLLTESDRLPPSVRALLEEGDLEELWVVGGPSVVSDAVLRQVQDAGVNVVRIAGPDRHATAIAVAEHAAGYLPAESRPAVPPSSLAVASGSTPYDALSSSAVLGGGMLPHPIVLMLVDADRLPEAVAERARVTSPWALLPVIGGPAAVSEDVVSQLASQLGADLPNGGYPPDPDPGPGP